MRRRDVVGMSVAAAAALIWSAASAQETQQNYPSRPIRLIVPSSAGGVHDVIARIWADRVKSSLGSIVVENRSGGGASIAINAVAQSQPDGYTFLLGSTSNLVLREGLGNRVYDAARDLVPASIFATTSTSITVNPSVPAKTVQELIEYIKANPGKLSYGSGGTGAITHITVEMFKQMAGGLDIVHIPYKGMAPAMNDLLSGQIAVGFVNITAQVVALHRSGKIRILAVNAPARLEAVPDIPTAAEAGLPNFVSQTFFGVFAAAGTPKAALDKVNEVTQARWSDSEFQQRLIEFGLRADARPGTRAGRTLPQRRNRPLGPARASERDPDAAIICGPVCCPSVSATMQSEPASALMGRSVPRLEDAKLLRGAGRFVDDIDLPHLLHAAFVRSPVAHGLLQRVDADRARALPGVRAVLTYADLRPHAHLRPHSARAAGPGAAVSRRSMRPRAAGGVLRRRADCAGRGRKQTPGRGRRGSGRARLTPPARSSRSARRTRAGRAQGAARLFRQSGRPLGGGIRRRRARIRRRCPSRCPSTFASTRAAAIRSRRAASSRATMRPTSCSRSGTARRCRTRPSGSWSKRWGCRNSRSG